MRTNTLNPLDFILPASVKIVFSLSIIAYGIFNFSAHYWILVALLLVAILAMSERISGLKTFKTTASYQRVVDADGGTFSQIEKNKSVPNSRPVVQDGGLYKRKEQNQL